MTDALLADAVQKEALSRAYVSAVAARAGYVTAVYSEDRDGIDLRIQAGGVMRPALELQLKATIRLGDATDGCFRFPLPLRNYDLLRDDTQTPRLLVVLCLPRNRSDWMTITPSQLVLRRCAYWLSLRGYKPVPNRTSVTVRIPEANVFDVEAARELMEQSRKGGIHGRHHP